MRSGPPAGWRPPDWGPKADLGAAALVVSVIAFLAIVWAVARLLP